MFYCDRSPPPPAGACPDVVWVQASDNYGTLQASKLGLMSVGSATDARLLVGETVITSMLAYMLPARPRRVPAHDTLGGRETPSPGGLKPKPG